MNAAFYILYFVERIENEISTSYSSTKFLYPRGVAHSMSPLYRSTVLKFHAFAPRHEKLGGHFDLFVKILKQKHHTAFVIIVAMALLASVEMFRTLEYSDIPVIWNSNIVTLFLRWGGRSSGVSVPGWRTVDDGTPKHDSIMGAWEKKLCCYLASGPQVSLESSILYPVRKCSCGKTLRPRCRLLFQTVQ